MLRGRESLIRLVGKRRRFLPNRESLLSYSSSIQGSLNVCSDKGGKIGLIESTVCSEIANEESVCPVCGDKIRGNNYSFNSHLDVCLSRGSKRKLTQRTLLEMNFCSSSKVQMLSPQKRQPVNNHDEGKGILRSSSCELSNDIEEDSISLSVSPLGSESVGKIQAEGTCESPVPDNKTDDSNEIDCLFIEDKGDFTDTVITVESLSDVLLETLIVGRKFVNEKEISQGDRILLLRDPLNPKDSNAVKVVSADSEDSKFLGFLPRELAQYMSPLIDKYCLNFEGQVTAIPKTSLEHVPIQLFCRKEGVDQNIGNDNMELFRYLWRNVLQVIESPKNRQTSTTKYQLNFSVLVREVLQSNSHLFIESERDFLESLSSFTDDSQRLFVRLYTRKGPWFRVSNISYPEILDRQRAIEQLSGTGYMHYIDDTNKFSFEYMSEILNVLNVAELREIMSVLKQRCNCGTRKQDFVESLLSSYQDGLCPTLRNIIFEITGGCVRISTTAESLFWRVERLFFLNGEQDLSSFLLADLGIIKYPNYNCIITEPIFSDRNDLLAYEESIEVAQMIDEALDEQDKESVFGFIKIAESRMSNTSVKAADTFPESSVTFCSCFSAPWVYSKILTLGASFLEHVRRYDEAILLLKFLIQCVGFGRRRGYWILRLSIDLEHIGYHDESLSVAESGLKDTWVRAGSRMALQRRILRLAKPPRRWKTPSFANSVERKIKEVHVRGRPLNCVSGVKSRFYGDDGEQCGVEQLALQYYAGEGGGWQGVHTESGIWLTIFGLLFWDVIFSDVPNVFRTKFQTAPLDLDTDSFYLARKTQIESHLQRIEQGMAEEIVITSWETRTGTACRGVRWDRHTLAELRAAVACIGGSCLALLCRHLAQDYQSWSSGMPDLLLWRFHTRFGPEAKLVEVKGPRDRLSEQQRAWLLLLMDCGFDAEVCKVGPELTSGEGFGD